MKKIVFATNNQHKLQEVRAIVGQYFDVLSLRDIECNEEIPENGTTFEENALMKAHYIKDNYGYDCFADDSGLEVVALNNAPGVYSARYAGEPSDSQRNIEKLMREMQDKKERSARFRTSIALLLDGEEKLFDGCIEGDIIDVLRGCNGFGYDPLFVPRGYDITFAEMSSEEKNKISHRAIATQKLIEYLLGK
ncbi:MAG: non-canonical purine NTP diphosphatase [Bacteroidaceae bacterium]|nr:non-canonical purine NTP diphosphatase [Bacteroidaceae bacterium]MBR5002909.1 non-canonical purine NTP diphosphatase [Bacteroidaceae bacterium]